MSRQFRQGDIWGGLSSAAVILPQAMAFGVALWGPYQIDLGTAALTGLLTVIVLNLFSGLSAGTPGMVSSPTGPTMVLVSGALITFSQMGYSGENLQTLFIIMLLCSGLLQILLGLTNGGHLIKFIPSPVVSGFMTGSAILMILSQLSPVRGSASEELTSWNWLPLMTATVTFVAITYSPKFFPKLPGTVAGLLLGTVFFHFTTLVSSAEILPGWLIGTLPAITSINIGISISALSDIPWAAMLPVSIALAVLASLDSLLTSVVADVETGERHHAKRELVGQGLGHIFSGLLGGTAGAGTTGATVVAIRSGGHYWVSIITSLVFLIFILLLAPVVSILPISVLAGIILHVAIMGMIERDMLVWFSRKKTRVDGTTAIIVTIVTVTFDLMIAVGVGVAIAILRFVQMQITTPVIHRRSIVSQKPSLRKRTEDEKNILHEHGDRIVLYELKGNLFFGTTDRMFNDLISDLDRKAWVILDMRRVSHVDLSAVKMIDQMALRLQSHGGEMLFSGVRHGQGLGKEVKKTLKKINPYSKTPDVKTFIDADEALDYSENALLKEYNCLKESVDEKIDVNKIDIFSDMDQQDIKKIIDVAKHQSAKAGEYLFYEGDYGDSLYVILKGELDILLPYGSRHYKRIATFGPGTYTGEVVFLSPGKRTAHCKVARDTELLIITNEHLKILEEQHPQAAIRLLKILGSRLGQYLRRTDIEVMRLSE